MANHVKTLVDAGALDASSMSAKHKKKINDSLSDSEVKAIISAVKKTGLGPIKPKPDDDEGGETGGGGF